ncbi:hypothetical protein AVEN_178388-1 [Araneus ventricosus]|uniref:Uncharacterized protein n=1 Tax=Araneus ventricosus TaxID=182803 RepID=A0A4Y2BCQ2_ARAVE|nr:hypothetical protein AVEN_178388-1 [Araneus ventricosus]
MRVLQRVFFRSLDSLIRSLSDVCKLSKRASKLFKSSFGEEGVSPSRPKRMSQGNLGVRSESFSAEVHPVTDLLCSVLGPFRVLQAWDSLHHFRLLREVGQNKIAHGFYVKFS